MYEIFKCVGGAPHLKKSLVGRGAEFVPAPGAPLGERAPPSMPHVRFLLLSENPQLLAIPPKIDLTLNIPLLY